MIHITSIWGKSDFGNLEKLCFEQIKCLNALNLCNAQLLKMGIVMYASLILAEFVLMLYILANNFLIMSGCLPVFLG